MLPPPTWPSPPPTVPVPAPNGLRPVRARRVVAALVDLVPLTVLAIAWAEHESSADGVRYQLRGPAFALVLGVAVAQFVVCEALTGTSPGKRLLGLTVVRDDGGRPGWRTAIVRNGFRVVDGLPVFYLVGLIVFLATPHRQRVGDLVAHTRVVRRDDPAIVGSPPKAWGDAVLVGAVAAVVALAVVGFARPDPSDGIGRFDYADDVVPFVEGLADDVFRNGSTDALAEAFLPGAVTDGAIADSMGQLERQLGKLEGRLRITDHDIQRDVTVPGFGRRDVVQVYAEGTFERAPAEVRFQIVDDDGTLRLLRWDARLTPG